MKPRILYVNTEEAAKKLSPSFEKFKEYKASDLPDEHKEIYVRLKDVEHYFDKCVTAKEVIILLKRIS